MKTSTLKEVCEHARGLGISEVTFTPHVTMTAESLHQVIEGAGDMMEYAPSSYTFVRVLSVTGEYRVYSLAPTKEA